MSKDTNFKFGTHALRESPEVLLEKIFEHRAWLGSRDPLNFGALNANSFKTVEDANFKFGTDTPRGSRTGA